MKQARRPALIRRSASCVEVFGPLSPRATILHMFAPHCAGCTKLFAPRGFPKALSYRIELRSSYRKVSGSAVMCAQGVCSVRCLGRTLSLEREALRPIAKRPPQAGGLASFKSLNLHP